MAKELAHFKNFAKLKDTKVAFNDITVIAGKPGTGKSYVMKMMYAIDETIFLLNQDTFKLSEQIDVYKLYNSYLQQINALLNDNDIDKNLKKLREVSKNIESLKNENSFLSNSHISDSDAAEELENKLSNLLNSIFINIGQISDNFKLTIGDSFIIDYDKELHISSGDHNSKEDEESRHLKLSEIIFVETPLILEFIKFMDKTEGKSPYHIESLMKILKTDYSFTDEEEDKFIENFRKKSKEIIYGDIHSDGDSFSFKKDDKIYDIINASSGTKSIGLLQYLVTNKALKKGSVLYWEEPEVHLHPEWQLRMIELFVELMNAGVKIVFSTHSPYMCDYLNAISKKKDNNFSDRVSFNLFEEKEGIVENHILENQKDWNKIQAELLDPLEEIMWEYV